MNYKDKIAALILSFLLFVSFELSANQGKIALLFLTRSDLNHPKLWQQQIEKSKDLYNVYIHSVKPLSDPYFAGSRISKIVPTSWSIHVKAWQVLIQEAIKNPENEKFVFLSEACIPLYSLDKIYAILISDPRTHMAFSKPWWPSSNPREITELFPQYRFGNAEWMVLNRRHAEIIAQDEAIIRVVARHPNDQESYFASLFAVHNCLPEVANHSFTYVNWRDAINGGASPWHFFETSNFNENLLGQAYSSGAIFARKFTTTYPEDVLIDMIENQTLHYGGPY